MPIANEAQAAANTYTDARKMAAGQCVAARMQGKRKAAPATPRRQRRGEFLSRDDGRASQLFDTKRLGNKRKTRAARKAVALRLRGLDQAWPRSRKHWGPCGATRHSVGHRVWPHRGNQGHRLGNEHWPPGRSLLLGGAGGGRVMADGPGRAREGRKRIGCPPDRDLRRPS